MPLPPHVPDGAAADPAQLALVLEDLRSRTQGLVDEAQRTARESRDAAADFRRALARMADTLEVARKHLKDAEAVPGRGPSQPP